MSLETPDESFYKNGATYWEKIPATVDGMLGGFGYISEEDIKCSKILLKQLFNSQNPPGRQYALDCGAGIGRITKFLLTNYFEKVDLVEQNPIFLKQAQQYLGPHLEGKIGEYYPIGLQKFSPEKQKYDVIWMQWVLGHLINSDLIHFLKSCKTGLKPNGVLIVKENITSSDEVEVDSNDSSVTRPISLFKTIFMEAGFDCYLQMKQTNFPKRLYSVYMFVLKPKKQDEEEPDVDNTTVSDIQ